MKRATLLAKLQKHIEKGRSMQTLAHTLVQLAKKDTQNNIQPSKM